MPFIHIPIQVASGPVDWFPKIVLEPKKVAVPRSFLPARTLRQAFLSDAGNGQGGSPIDFFLAKFSHEHLRKIGLPDKPQTTVPAVVSVFWHNDTGHVFKVINRQNCKCRQKARGIPTPEILVTRDME